MLSHIEPIRLIVIGFALLVGSWCVLLLMVIRVIAPGFLLSLTSYASSLAGLIIGLFGIVQYVRHARSE